MNNLLNFKATDLKAAITRVKAAVMNLSELEQKVREATNNETWGASSTLMQELSRATFNPQGFNEVMPAIYNRFSQEGRTWRNIYKALILLEYIIGNGSERAVDYCKSHIYEIKACTSYNYVDQNGKDQGANVRVRAKAIAEMLQDDAKICEHRQKAAEYKKKVHGQSASSWSSSSGDDFGQSSSSYSNTMGSGKYDGYPGQFTGSSSSSSGFQDSSAAQVQQAWQQHKQQQQHLQVQVQQQQQQQQKQQQQQQQQPQLQNSQYQQARRESQESSFSDTEFGEFQTAATAPAVSSAVNMSSLICFESSPPRNPPAQVPINFASQPTVSPATQTVAGALSPVTEWSAFAAFAQTNNSSTGAGPAQFNNPTFPAMSAPPPIMTAAAPASTYTSVVPAIAQHQSPAQVLQIQLPEGPKTREDLIHANLAALDSFASSQSPRPS